MQSIFVLFLQSCSLNSFSVTNALNNLKILLYKHTVYSRWCERKPEASWQLPNNVCVPKKIWPGWYCQIQNAISAVWWICLLEVKTISRNGHFACAYWAVGMKMFYAHEVQGNIKNKKFLERPGIQLVTLSIVLLNIRAFTASAIIWALHITSYS